MEKRIVCLAGDGVGPSNGECEGSIAYGRKAIWTSFSFAR